MADLVFGSPLGTNVTEDELSFSDNTTSDVSTAVHGLCPKAPNDTGQFLRGDASWAATPAADPGEGHIILHGINYDAIVSGTFTFEGSYTDTKAVFGRTNTDGNGNEINWLVYLAAGTYKIIVVYETVSSGGILDIDVGGTERSSVDTYNASQSWNNRDVSSTWTEASSGVKTIALRVDGQNASSTGFVGRFQSVTIVRTA